MKKLIPTMTTARLTLLACAMTAGCAALKPASPDGGVLVVPTASTSSVVAAAPASTVNPNATLPVPPETVANPAPAPKAAMANAEPKAESKAEPKAEPKSVPKAESQGRAIKQAEIRATPEPRAQAGVGEQPRAKFEAKANFATPVVSEPTKAAAPVVAERKAEPSLNISDLTTGLRETHAIGTFTKLALKNQLDDLLQRFRTTHQSGQQPRAAGLRQPFDALVGKVLGLLQSGDPALAHKIQNSREGIWSILSDPQKFKSIT